MNPTLYTQLSPLGFAEWLNKKLDAKIYFNKWMTEKDKLPLDSIGRTELNALAFRWLREEKDISCHVDFNRTNEWYYRIDSISLNEYLYHSSDDNKYTSSHPLAEHEALNKALEILSKGGENGN